MATPFATVHLFTFSKYVTSLGLVRGDCLKIRYFKKSRYAVLYLSLFQTDPNNYFFNFIAKKKVIKLTFFKVQNFEWGF